MPKKINIHIELDEKWSQSRKGDFELFFKGYAFYQDKAITKNDILDLLIPILESPPASINKQLNLLNGCFTCIIRTGNWLFACVDRARSIPLFYSRLHNTVYISNDAHWVKDKVGIEEFDKTSEAEFLFTGYVTGPNTLYSGIHQLQAGEYLLYKDDEVKIERYFRFFHAKTFSSTESELLRHLDDVIHNVFQRFVDWAGGRPIVIPVSGGHDSRLIATMLKKLEYDNLMAFSYGKEGNKEAEVSRQVANALGIRWEFIEYTHEAWRKWFHSAERRDYYRMADGLSSIPVLSNWPAVWEMQKRGLIAQNSIFAPGHTVTMALRDRPQKSTERSVKDSVYRKHYSLWPKMKIPKATKNLLLEKIWENTKDVPKNSQDWGIDYLEAWELQERQVKFIVNSVRVFDYFRFDWYLPLWDTELIEFWRRVPTDLRIDKKLFVSYVKHTYSQVTGVFTPINDPPLKSLKRFLSSTPLQSLSRKAYRAIRANPKKTTEYHNHEFAIFGLIPEQQFSELYSGYENIVSFLCLDRLGKINIDND